MSTVFVVTLILFGLLQVVYCQDNTTATPTDYCQSGLCNILKKHIACRNKGVSSPTYFNNWKTMKSLIIIFLRSLANSVPPTPSWLILVVFMI